MAQQKRLLDTLRSIFAAGHPAGEVGLEDQPISRPTRASADGWWPAYGYETTGGRTNYAKTRALYKNELPAYKLGAGFARPIINSTSGFLGVPEYKTTSGNEEADAEIEKVFKRLKAKLFLSSRNSMRDGDVFARLTYETDRFDPEEQMWNLHLVPPEDVEPLPDPITKAWQQVTITYHIPAPDKNGRAYTLTETLTPTTRAMQADEHAPPDVQAQYDGTPEANEWGVIPLIHFKNEAEEEDPWGTSDLQALDPLFRAYHDTIMIGISGIQLFAKPKVKLQVKNVDEFIANNFPEAARSGGKINFRGREVLLMREGEDAAYITAEPGSAGVQILLELLFYCIVQTSETPEFVFGTAVASSKASVSEQMVPYTKHIERKRMSFDQAYHDLGRLYLSMAQKVGDVGVLDSLDVELTWPEITPRDEQSIANTIKTLMDAFSTGITAGIISPEAAAEYLRDLIPTMLAWADDEADEDESTRLAEGLAIIERAKSGNLPETPDVEALRAGLGLGGPGVPTLPPGQPQPQVPPQFQRGGRQGPASAA